jgi:Ca2+/Na+ antiporter
VDEVGFAALAIVVPVALMQWGVDTQWFLVPSLLGFFVVYQIVDKRINRPPKRDNAPEQAVGNLPFGLILGLTALIAITVAGVFLGDATADVVKQMGIRPAIAGWILGTVTSIPELVTFFAVYAASRKEGRLHDLNDTQEALDNLTGSNMSNVGVVYPVGLFAFLLVTSLWSG